MKTLKQLSIIVCALILGACAGSARAADDVKTITGQAKCAKCALHEADKCQTVIQVKEGGKTVSYYLADNDKAKDFHDSICKKPAEATATGTVKKVNGKMELTVNKIELVKKADAAKPEAAKPAPSPDAVRR